MVQNNVNSQEMHPHDDGQGENCEKYPSCYHFNGGNCIAEEIISETCYMIDPNYEECNPTCICLRCDLKRECNAFCDYCKEGKEIISWQHCRGHVPSFLNNDPLYREKEDLRSVLPS